jgi:hypothetical protein
MMMYVFTKKKHINMYIYPLSRIHFGLDNRECLNYIIIFNFVNKFKNALRRGSTPVIK